MVNIPGQFTLAYFGGTSELDNIVKSDNFILGNMKK
jgi:hypothetical protein